MTVKSPIFEGTFTSDFTAEITNSDPLNIPVNEFVGTDVYGDNYYIGNIYSYDKNNNATLIDELSEHIKDGTVKLTLADENAENYLHIDKDTPDDILINGKKYNCFTISRKSIPSGLQVDTPCKLTVSFTDNWGRIKSTTITVVLKKTVK